MSRKIKIFAGPNNYDFNRLYFEEADEYIVGVDSGLAYLVNLNIKIDLAIGDFDSLDQKLYHDVVKTATSLIRLEKDKSMTDLAYAVDYLYNNMDYDKIEIYGGLGGRIDHLQANINLLKRYSLSYRDDKHHIYALAKGRHIIDNFHTYISFFALEDCYNLSLTGFKFELNNYFLSSSDSLCVSNQGSGSVAFSKGRLMVIESDDDYK
ncbi:MAG: thiamine diphosphokinase [Candidatus Izemoplasmatales bacterium]|jgi:thiamine pyrophosphokinase